MVRAKGCADIGKYTVKGNTVTITSAAPGGTASMTLKVEKDGCLSSPIFHGELCKQK